MAKIWRKLGHKKVDICVCYVCTLSKNLKLPPLTPAPALRAGARFARKIAYIYPKKCFDEKQLKKKKF